jgi:cytidine deaminase
LRVSDARPAPDDLVLEGAVEAARAARARAYAPYSGFAVGAAVLAGGRLFTGVNVENASYPLGVCAERNAVASMVAAGERRIDAVAVVAGGESVATPCGGCRQVLREFSSDTTAVLCVHVDGRRERFTVAGLLPHAFTLDA